MKTPLWITVIPQDWGERSAQALDKLSMGAEYYPEVECNRGAKVEKLPCGFLALQCGLSDHPARHTSLHYGLHDGVTLLTASIPDWWSASLMTYVYNAHHHRNLPTLRLHSRGYLRQQDTRLAEIWVWGLVDVAHHELLCFRSPIQPTLRFQLHIFRDQMAEADDQAA